CCIRCTPKIDYSVLDTMISITIGSVLRYKKIVKALKNLKKGLDRIGRQCITFLIAMYEDVGLIQIMKKAWNG
ncbi:MAG: hypothetical protein IKP88_18685, partial [Lachnospiraceae bacterium]|nr:hypothetical protein [Lachnospiraceae bacterium]